MAAPSSSRQRHPARSPPHSLRRLRRDVTQVPPTVRHYQTHIRRTTSGKSDDVGRCMVCVSVTLQSWCWECDGSRDWCDALLWCLFISVMFGSAWRASDREKLRSLTPYELPPLFTKLSPHPCTTGEWTLQFITTLKFGQHNLYSLFFAYM